MRCADVPTGDRLIADEAVCSVDQELAMEHRHRLTSEQHAVVHKPHPYDTTALRDLAPDELHFSEPRRPERSQTTVC